MKNLEELLWKENNLKEELPADGTQAMKQVCITICCAGGSGGIGYPCIPRCAAGISCR